MSDLSNDPLRAFRAAVTEEAPQEQAEARAEIAADDAAWGAGHAA